MTDYKNCPVCGLNHEDEIVRVEPSVFNGSNTAYYVNCKRCGQYTIITKRLLNELIPNYKLSAWIRERNEQKITISPITETIRDEIMKSIPNYNVLEKQNKLLNNIIVKSKPGEKVFLSFIYDWPLAWASSELEFKFYINALEERRLIKKDWNQRDRGYEVTISPIGWEYLERNKIDIEEKSQAFVAMSFSDKMKPIWENSIKPAIEDSGYSAYRIDYEPHIDRIDVKIMAEIQNSRFIVADVTEQKHGVYFEAGYALGLKLPVIWCVKKEELNDVHFDTSHYNHIPWETEKELNEQLYNFICAIIGKRRV